MKNLHRFFSLIYSSSKPDKLIVANRTPQLSLNTVEIKTKISEYITQDWSPEQVAGRLKKDGVISIHHETIYQYVLAYNLNPAITRYYNQKKVDSFTS